MQKTLPVLFILFSLILTSCGSVDPPPGDLDPTGLPVAATANEPQSPAAESAPQQPAQPAIIAPPAMPASTGVWLVSVLEEDNILLRALSADENHVVELGPVGNLGYAHFSASPNSEQPWFSLYSSEDNGLTLTRIPDRIASNLIVLLASKELQTGQKQLLQKEFLRVDQPAQVWSPDGTHLAYLDVPSGTNTRLMVFDTATGTSSPLSETTEDVVAPVWSPDGQWILYQTIDGFTSQGLPQVTGLHAVRVNGSENRLLYQPASLRETILGWASPEIFVVQSLIERGNRDLRLVSLSDNSSLSLNPGLIKQANWNAKTQTAMYLLTASETNNEQPNGVYAVSASTPQRMVLPGKWEYLKYFEPSGIWIATLPGAAGLILPDGSTVNISGVDSVAGVSPNGKLVLINQTNAGLGLFSTDGKILVNVTEKPVKNVFFTPDSKSVFFTIENSGFYAASPDWKPIPRTDFTNLVGWVGN